MKLPSNLEGLDVNEIFHTIQGEGLNSGKPSIFIRLTGCNLRCVWCDTKYTWLYDHKTLVKLQTIVADENLTIHDLTIYDKKTEVAKMKIADVIRIVQSFNCNHIVITGGEPLLQKVTLIKLLEKLSDYSVEIETNGTISPKGMPSHVVFNVSPKLSNSFNPRNSRYKEKIMKEFRERNSTLKYVISEPNDIKEVLDQLDDLKTSQTVILMPEASNNDALRHKQEWLIELCKKHNFLYGNRLHVQIFGSKRGV